jgi:xylan 1,4-beta-xylosidase
MKRIAATLTTILCVAVPSIALAQDPVGIQVDAQTTLGPFKPIFQYFGYDEPNYTYAKYGPKLIGEVARLGPATTYVRTHCMLCTGDGKYGFKFGSTNIYTEDASGKPVYDFTITDRIFDTYLNAGAKPYVEIGFMPQALSTKPDPYTPTWIPGARNDQYYIGWSYPPKDFDKWSELVYQWVKHTVQKYGRAEVESWYWEVWNEPDIAYWHGTPEEYDHLYEATVTGVRKALPTARVGGPATTSPRNARAGEYLRQFLAYCEAHKLPLDFISFHAKGVPRVTGDHVQMGVSSQMNDVDQGLTVIGRFPQYAKLPVILSEADPEGCAACSARVYPNNAYRNGTLYPSYTAVALNNIIKLADRHNASVDGMLTWAFEFEDQPYFDGFRTLATNGIDKPVLNVFRMYGLMHGDRVKTESTGAVDLDTILKTGVRERADVNALATRSAHDISTMVWNYLDDDQAGPAAAVTLTVNGIPADANKVLLRQYRIDQEHSNAYTAWKAMGSPQNPTPEQYRALEAAGQLQTIGSPAWVKVDGGKITTEFTLPRQGISLVQVSW